MYHGYRGPCILKRLLYITLYKSQFKLISIFNNLPTFASEDEVYQILEFDSQYLVLIFLVVVDIPS